MRAPSKHQWRINDITPAKSCIKSIWSVVMRDVSEINNILHRCYQDAAQQPWRILHNQLLRCACIITSWASDVVEIISINMQDLVVILLIFKLSFHFPAIVSFSIYNHLSYHFVLFFSQHPFFFAEEHCTCH